MNRKCKAIVVLFVVFIIVISPVHMMSLAEQNPYFPGNGTAESPYLIESAQDLARFAALVNTNTATYNSGHYRLVNDISLAGYHWTPIASFDGVFQPKEASYPSR